MLRDTGFRGFRHGISIDWKRVVREVTSAGSIVEGYRAKKAAEWGMMKT